MDLKQSQRNQLNNNESGGEIYVADRRTMAAEKCILPPASSLLYPFEHSNTPMRTTATSSSSGSRSNFSNSPTEVTDEQYVQSILDVTDIGLVVYSILDARVLFWNRAAKQMFGYDDDSNFDYHHHHYSSGSGSQGGGHIGGHGSRTSEKVKMVKRWMDLLHPQYIPLTDAQLERRVFDVKCSTEMQTTEIYANLAFENIETGAIAECLSVSTGFVSRGYAVMEITFRDHLKHEQRAELSYEESAPSQQEEREQQQQDDVQQSQRTYQTAQVQELGQSPQQHQQQQHGHYEQQKSSPPITSSSSSSSASTSHHHQHRNQSHGETHHRDHRYPFIETQYGRQQQQQSSSIAQSPVDSSSSSVSSDAGTSTVTQSPMLPSFDEGFRSSASSAAVVATAAAPPPAVMHHHQQQYQSTTTATTTPLHHHHHRDGPKPTLQ